VASYNVARGLEPPIGLVEAHHGSGLLFRPLCPPPTSGWCWYPRYKQKDWTLCMSHNNERPCCYENGCNLSTKSPGICASKLSVAVEVCQSPQRMATSFNSGSHRVSCGTDTISVIVKGDSLPQSGRCIIGSINVFLVVAAAVLAEMFEEQEKFISTMVLHDLKEGSCSFTETAGS
jgi:hypothetical protein